MNTSADDSPALVTLMESPKELREIVGEVQKAPYPSITITTTTGETITGKILLVRYRGDKQTQSVRLRNESSIINVLFPEHNDEPVIAEVYDFIIPPNPSVNPDG